MKTLDTVRAKTSVIIKSLRRLDADYRRQLQVMGVIPGATISVIRSAPLGDPMQIQANNTNLGLRKREAALIEVI